MIKINSKIIKYFEILADETRLRILVIISKGPTTVTEIHKQVLNLTFSAISHQLSLMKKLDIVKAEKKGRKKYYQLSDRYCWCPLRDALSQYSKKTKCPHCAEIIKNGGKLI